MICIHFSPVTLIKHKHQYESRLGCYNRHWKPWCRKGQHQICSCCQCCKKTRWDHPYLIVAILKAIIVTEKSSFTITQLQPTILYFSKRGLTKLLLVDVTTKMFWKDLIWTRKFDDFCHLYNNELVSVSVERP